MRRVDRWIGAPMCAALTIARRIGDVVRRRPTDAPRRVAAIKLAEQGATVLAYPALDRMKREIGEDNVYFVVFEQNRFIVDLLRVVRPENVLVIRATGLVRTALDTLKVLVRMRRERIDATLDCEFFARSSAILSYLSGARIRVGFHAYHGEASYRGDLMTHRLSFNPFLHASQIFDLLVEALSLDPAKLPAAPVDPVGSVDLPRHTPRPEDVSRVESILRETLGRDDLPPLVLLNANCGDLLPLRRWEPERYVDLARRVLERYRGIAIGLTGAPSEAPDAEALVARIGSPRCVSLAGKTTLEQLFALYGLAELMVTNDSGPAHYATVTPIDVITLFGPETPAVFGARTPRSHILWAGIACSPCVNAFNDRQSACTDNVCMQRITVDRVFEEVCRVLEQRASEGRSIRPLDEHVTGP